jgi:uncharacterized protein (TIGR02217 family)
MAFHEIRFPSDLSFGASGGPERRTEIVTLANGFEERNTSWAHSRRRYDAGLGLRSLSDIEALIAFFEERRGQLHAFRWKDWADYRSGPPDRPPSHLDQILGIGDGTTTHFQLIKSYGTGPTAYVRPIAKPVEGKILIGLEGAPVSIGADCAVDTSTGQIRFATAPFPEAIVTAGFEYDVPARFDVDRLNISLDTFQAGQAPNIPVVEVRV